MTEAGRPVALVPVSSRGTPVGWGAATWDWGVINPQLGAGGRSPEQPQAGLLCVPEPSFPVLLGRSRAYGISPSADQALTTPAGGGQGIWTRFLPENWNLSLSGPLGAVFLGRHLTA